MRLIRDILTGRPAANRPALSFEFFPPKTEEGERSFMQKTVPALKALRPDFCSVTYGAGGGTREKTLSIVDRLQREHGLTSLAHLTCVGSTREEIRGTLEEGRRLGIRNILALRGDPPEGTREFQATAGGFAYASELVGFLRELGGFCVGVAGFPEGHSACKAGREADWEHLRRKIAEGADYVITQLFFDNWDFYRFRDYLTIRGVTVPILPGIIPILSTSQIKRFTAMCGATIPPPLLAELDRLGDDDEATAAFGVDYASRQCEDLMRQGVPGLHFYTLNRARSTSQILRNLGLASADPSAARPGSP
jgi:methylenetetrahydrofolate reductase (NADPH)